MEQKGKGELMMLYERKSIIAEERKQISSL